MALLTDLERKWTRMANKKYNYKEEYVYGAAAPKREYAAPKKEPQRIERNKEVEKQRVREQQASENRRKASRFGALYTFFVVTAVAVTLFVCTSYIKQINMQNEQNKEIVTLKEQLNELREANDQKELTIDTSVDFNYIYNVATKELGMVHASPEQVIAYESGESEYVIQYGNIPGN